MLLDRVSGAAETRSPAKTRQISCRQPEGLSSVSDSATSRKSASWQQRAELVGDFPPLRASGLEIDLSKCGGDEGAHDTPRAVAGMRQYVAERLHLVVDLGHNRETRLSEVLLIPIVCTGSCTKRVDTT
jgi:hypothetical protein